MVKQVTKILSPSTQCNLQKYVQKLSKAGHIAISIGFLQRDRIQFLTRINEEAKIQRSAEADMLGKAKVMGYNKLEEARTKRGKKEAAKAAKR
ncbi:DDE-domain-containing protein [Curvularia clavata]|uniref:DDE-domain-containing protein n=1 Tax=Curvularia clavata TaxID=95742 RepID=A0A9Q9DSQ9_CURCL|nr:DDE-domain-containing protein [Curvularia clavata]